MVSTLKKRDLLSLAVWKDPPVCDVSVDLCKYKGSVVLHLQVSLLNGRHWTWTAAEHAWGANLHWFCVPSRQKKVKGGSVPSLLSCGVGSKICHPLFPFGRSCLLIQDSTQQWKFLNQRGENRIQHRELAAVLSKTQSLVPPVAVLPTVEGVHQVHAEVPVHVMSRAEVGDEACGDSQTAQDYGAIRWVWSSTRGRSTSDGVSPVHATPANTQHWPYFTALAPELLHCRRIGTLPVHLLGTTPSEYGGSHFPANTPRSSLALTCRGGRDGVLTRTNAPLMSCVLHLSVWVSEESPSQWSSCWCTPGQICAPCPSLSSSELLWSCPELQSKYPLYCPQTEKWEKK